MHRVWKIAIFDQCLALSRMWYKTELYCPIGNGTLSNGAIFNYVEQPITETSRSRHYLTLNISETGRDTRHSYNEIVMGTYTRPTLSDPEWPWPWSRFGRLVPKVEPPLCITVNSSDVILLSANSSYQFNLVASKQRRFYNVIIKTLLK